MATLLTRFSTVGRNIRGRGPTKWFCINITFQLRADANATMHANCGIVAPPFLGINTGNSFSKEGCSGFVALQGATNLSE